MYFLLDIFNVAWLNLIWSWFSGECVDRPGGGSGWEDQRPAELSSGISPQAQQHRGDASTGAKNKIK